jgi:HEAT repeat protein
MPATMTVAEHDEKTADSGRFFELMAASVAAGLSIRAAAESCGCSERQGYRLSGSHEFKIRVASLRSEMTSSAVGKLSSAACEAVQTLRQLLGDDFDASVRIQAAKAILGNLRPLAELSELRERIDELERGR